MIDEDDDETFFTTKFVVIIESQPTELAMVVLYVPATEIKFPFARV